MQELGPLKACCRVCNRVVLHACMPVRAVPRYAHEVPTLCRAVPPVGGFPITLRHRLHCTIVRCSSTCPPGNGSSAACGGANSSSSEGLPSVSTQCVGHCVYGEEHVSLNEVVIERGISPFLTNLECFCDGTFVTHVQVSERTTCPLGWDWGWRVLLAANRVQMMYHVQGAACTCCCCQIRSMSMSM